MRTTIATVLTATGFAFAFTPGLADMPYRGDGHVMVTPDELVWTGIASMAAPAEMAVIEGDLGAEEPFTFRLRLPDG